MVGICFFTAEAGFCEQVADKQKTKNENNVVISGPLFEVQKGSINVSVQELKYYGGQKFNITFVWNIVDPLENDYTVFAHFFSYEHGNADSEYVMFQRDYEPKIPTSSWKPKNPVVDGPFTIDIPSKCGPGVYYIGIGLYNEAGRFGDISGQKDGKMRAIIGRLVLRGTPGKITDVKFMPILTTKETK